MLAPLRSPAGAGEEHALEPPTETRMVAGSIASGRNVPALPARVGELIAREVELGEDENRWREEKAHLRTTAALLERERGELDRRLAAAEEKAGRTASERDELSRRIARAGGVLDSVGGAARAAGRRLLVSNESLPGPLGRMLKDGAARLRDAVFGNAGGDAAAAGAPGLLQLVAAFAADMRRVQASAHAVSQVLDLGDDGRLPVRAAARTQTGIEVDALYLGAAVGYFVAPGDRAAGVIARDGNTWKVDRRDELAPAVRTALAVRSKERPPALVDLPVPAPVQATSPAPDAKDAAKGGAR